MRNLPRGFPQQDRMAGTTGLEPAASAVTGQRSNQLNYVPTRQINGTAITAHVLDPYRLLCPRKPDNRAEDCATIHPNSFSGNRKDVRDLESARYPAGHQPML
jgi:hypothetical protein